MARGDVADIAQVLHADRRRVEAGRRQVPWNRRKNLEGASEGVPSSACGAMSLAKRDALLDRPAYPAAAPAETLPPGLGVNPGEPSTPSSYGPWRGLGYGALTHSSMNSGHAHGGGGGHTLGRHNDIAEGGGRSALGVRQREWPIQVAAPCRASSDPGRFRSRARAAAGNIRHRETPSGAPNGEDRPASSPCPPPQAST